MHWESVLLTLSCCKGKVGKGNSTFWEKSACVEVCGLLRDLYFIRTLCVFIKCYFVLNEHTSWSWESASKLLVLLFFALALNDSTTLPQLYYLQLSPNFFICNFCNQCSNCSGLPKNNVFSLPLVSCYLNFVFGKT